MIVGALIRYTGSTTPLLHIPVVPENSSQLNHLALPPDTLWLKFPVKDSSINKTYGYRFRGEIVDLDNNEIDLKVNTEYYINDEKKKKKSLCMSELFTKIRHNKKTLRDDPLLVSLPGELSKLK